MLLSLKRDIRADKEVLITFFNYLDFRGLDLDYIYNELLKWFDMSEEKNKAEVEDSIYNLSF